MAHSTTIDTLNGELFAEIITDAEINKYIQISNVYIQCKIEPPRSTHGVRFPVVIENHVKDAITKNLLNSSINISYMYAYLTILPELGMTKECTGTMEQFDWEKMDNQIIGIVGSFKIILKEKDTINGTYEFEIQCTDGTAYL